jgi:hypothetical protein
MRKLSNSRRRVDVVGALDPTAHRVVGSLVLAASLVPVFAASLAGGSVGAAVPYSDPASDGYIGLCNAQGQQITSGSVTTSPFAARAVSSAAATGAYVGPSRTAVLYAYQPVDGLAAADWSGDALTASTRYSNPASPMAAATTSDESLAGYMVEFSPKWDGLLQLRLLLGAGNEQPYTIRYPTLDIEVTGKTWHAVDGGPVNCRSGTAESIESILLPASSFPKQGGGTDASTKRSAPSEGAVPAASGTADNGSTHASSSSSQQSVAAAPASSAATRSSASSGTTWIPVVAALAGLAALALLLGVYLPHARKRRSTPAAGPPDDTDRVALAVTSTRGNER